MPLHPQAQTMLDQMALLGATELQDLPIDQARQFVAGTTGLAGPAVPVDHIEDREIPGPGGPVSVRIYRPAAREPLPVILDFHGGAWALGGIDNDDAACRALAAAVPAVVVNVGYRLAPESPYPAALDDGHAVLEWVGEHAGEIGANAARVALVGESAGGNLVAALALRWRDEGGRPPIRFQLLICPALDSSMSHPSIEQRAEGYLITRKLLAWAWTGYIGGGDPTDPYTSPLHAGDLSDLPPALVIIAEYDPLSDEGLAYANRLRQAGIEADARCYPGMIHGFARLGGVFDAARDAFDLSVDSLREALR